MVFCLLTNTTAIDIIVHILSNIFPMVQSCEATSGFGFRLQLWSVPGDQFGVNGFERATAFSGWWNTMLNRRWVVFTFVPLFYMCGRSLIAFWMQTASSTSNIISKFEPLRFQLCDCQFGGGTTSQITISIDLVMSWPVISHNPVIWKISRYFQHHQNP